MRLWIRPAVLLVSWVVTLGWTALVIYLLLKHGNTVQAGPFLTSFLRMEFTRDELLEAVAHFTMFGTLTLLWWWTLVQHYPVRYAVLGTVMIAVMLGMGTEFGQYFVARSSVLLDLVANLAGISIAMAGLQLVASRQRE